MKKIPSFYHQLQIGKCSEIRYFLSKFHSEGEFWHCHNPGNHLGLTNQTFNANLGSKNKKMCKVRPFAIPTVYQGGWVPNTDVIISYIHNLLLKIAYFQFLWEKGVIEIWFNKLKMCMCFQHVTFYAEFVALETKVNRFMSQFWGGGWVG